MTADDPAARLAVLANRVERLRPSSHDPEAYHVERDAIFRELRKLAGELATKRIDIPTPRGKFTAGSIEDNGRRVGVERRGQRARKPSEIEKVFR